MTLKISNLKSQISNTLGTTIVELLVYMGLLSIFLVVLLDVFTTTLNFKLQSESTSALNQDTRYILSKLSYDIYNADSVTNPASLGATSASLQLTNAGVVSSYSVDGNGDLILTTGGISTKLNGLDTQIQSITFKRLGNAGVADDKPTFQVLLTVESRIQLTSGLKTQSVQTTLGLR